MLHRQSRRAFLGRGLRLGSTAAAGSPCGRRFPLVGRRDRRAWVAAGAAPEGRRRGAEAAPRGQPSIRTGEADSSERDSVRRVEIAEGQEPFAIVLGCADSRVPPEVVFDQGLGDLFTVRVAGNTAMDRLIIGSIEYAATTFGSALAMVLGHDQCGAVKAAIDVALKGKTLPGSVGAVVEAIVPAVEQVRDAPEKVLLDQATRLNIQNTVKALRTADPLLTDLVNSGKLKVVGAEYQLKSGNVDMVVQ